MTQRYLCSIGVALLMVTSAFAQVPIDLNTWIEEGDPSSGNWIVETDGSRHASALAFNAPLAFEVPYEEIAPGLRVCAADVFDYLVRQYFVATIVGMVRREVLGDAIRFDLDRSL